ncbi:MAG TPA: RNA polymerase recycling motor HelD, partial [Bacillota bacterium]|nr:RNA polymerase recycling motor HelD [Bacillota bacterium]
MSIKQNEWKQERQRLGTVIDVIKTKKKKLQNRSSTIKKKIISLRQNFWDDVTINLDEPDDIIETEASMKQQAELLSDQERNHGQMYKQLEALERLEKTPYFGRIDFHEDREKHPEHIYIGMGSLMDENEDDFLIYDWRAPISSMYYDYTLERAYYETMDGPVEGDITLKRQYVIKNGKLDGLFNTGLTIGDHLLQEVLGRNSSEKMKTIVSTIQKEQNKIIRHRGSQNLIVQGVAGSGKTSIALQRVAYLLYANRHTLVAGNVLLFSPNPLFNSYVASVLPELGEENMHQSTFQEYANSRIGDSLNLEDPSEQMEKMLASLADNERDVRLQSIQYKASLECKEWIDVS